MNPDPFAWPEDARIAALRAELATLRAGLAEAIAYAERHDGRTPVGQLRTLLGGGS